MPGCTTKLPASNTCTGSKKDGDKNMKCHIGDEVYSIQPDADFSNKKVWFEFAGALRDNNETMQAIADLIDCGLLTTDAPGAVAIDPVTASNDLMKRIAENDVAIKYILEQITDTHEVTI